MFLEFRFLAKGPLAVDRALKTYRYLAKINLDEKAEAYRLRSMTRADLQLYSCCALYSVKIIKSKLVEYLYSVIDWPGPPGLAIYFNLRTQP